MHDPTVDAGAAQRWAMVREKYNGGRRKAMEKMLKEIKSGKFAREWIKENETGRPNWTALLKKGDEHKIEKVGQDLRKMMPWMKK